MTPHAIFLIRLTHEHEWADAMLNNYEDEPSTLALLIAVQHKCEQAGVPLAIVA